MSLKYTGSYEDLKSKLASLNGRWDETQPNKKVLKLNDGLMNWFESTGSINFQGKGVGKSELESKVPSLLYPQEDILPPVGKEVFSGTSSVGGNESRIELNNSTLARQYLERGINEGELIIGLVSAVGTESQRVIETLKDRLTGFGYAAKEIKVSSLLPQPLSVSSEYDRIKHFMKEGDKLRERGSSHSILAAGVAKEISRVREGSVSKRAYIVSSLKHPSEVEFLRKIYGDGFYLIGIHADVMRRHRYLTQDKGCTQAEADELIKTDEDETIDHGQKTRDTYHLADFFLNLGSNVDQVRNGLQRFLELVFSHPYKNPTFDEFAMFMAFNSSVRSGDLSRQVGAVIALNQQIVATGANDVPRSGGGLYWAEMDQTTGEVHDKDDGKDYTREGDSNKIEQRNIINEIAGKLLSGGLVSSSREQELSDMLAESRISDLTEFGRIVHAEMDALLSCSRSGISTAKTTLYCTTFPCHNCAKHIIAGGVRRVVYVEPYPKSRALDFHSESIKLRSEFDTQSIETSLVAFEPFIGIGPRRFLDLFSMSLGSGSKLKRKEKSGEILDWNQANAPIRTPLLPSSYLDIEREAAAIWNECLPSHPPF